MKVTYTIHAYEKNQVTLYAVQGEAESREIFFEIVEKSGTIIPASNAEIVNQMLDLTGYTAELYAMLGDSVAASCQGIIMDALAGSVKFILPAEFMTMAGKYHCVIILTKAATNLRIVGITLDVQPISADITIQQISIYRNRVWDTIVQLQDEGVIYVLSNHESLIFTVKDSENNIILQKTLTSADYDSTKNGYRLSLSSTETNISAGAYFYDIALEREDHQLKTVIAKSNFIVRE